MFMDIERKTKDTYTNACKDLMELELKNELHL